MSDSWSGAGIYTMNPEYLSYQKMTLLKSTDFMSKGLRNLPEGPLTDQRWGNLSSHENSKCIKLKHIKYA